MADMKGLAQTTSKSRVGNGQQRDITVFRDGALYTMDYALAAAIEGRVFFASSGTITTPLQFKAYDADQPDFVIDVPTGTTIVPIWLQVHLEDSAGTDTEILAVTSTGIVGAGTSTALTIASTRTNLPLTSGCKGYGIYAGNGTAPAGTVEFFRWGHAFADEADQPARVVEWHYSKTVPVVIVGPGALVVYVSATTTQALGYVKAGWMEFPSSDL